MRKLIFIALLAALLLAACGQATPAATATIEPTTAPVPTETAEEAAVKPTVVFQSSGPGFCEPESSSFPEVTESDWIEGSEQARVTLLVYSDFQCPYCSQLDPILNELVKENPKDFRIVFRHFPLPMHNNAKMAAQAVEAAGKQGKFFEMKAFLFEKQSEWAGLPAADFEKWLQEEADALKLNSGEFAAALKAKDLADKIQEQFNKGYTAGVQYTPFVIVNGEVYQGNLEAGMLLDYADFAGSKYKECPSSVAEKGKKYTATLKTEKGDIVIRLFPEQAPITVNSFIFLAQEGWYDGVTFHRVIPGFVAQSGDPSGTGLGSPGYYFSNEVTPDLRYDKAGMVGMANAGPDTNGSQFFITYSPQPRLDGQYTIFGEVTAGMDVLEKITPRDPQQGDLPPGDKILKILIEEE